MKKVSGDLDRDPVNLRWAPDGSGVYFDAQDRGSQNVYFAPAGGGTPKAVTSGIACPVVRFDVEQISSRPAPKPIPITRRMSSPTASAVRRAWRR